MKLMFLTFSPLSSNPGHLARLSGELDYLSEQNQVSIICLGKDPENEHTKKKHKNISFFHFPVVFDGWSVENSREAVGYINKIIGKTDTDSVILQMEVWDIMRDLGESLKGKVPFATIVHAMPFVVSPIDPSGDFEKDVVKYANSGLETYRKDYITNHYREVYDVFKNVQIIANNKTVEFYFKNYFPNLKVPTLSPSIVVRRQNRSNVGKDIKYDFVYMARIEKGKGIEYLEDILKRISAIMSRKITIAILGRADDDSSRESLRLLLADSDDNPNYKVDYIGWADILTKESILPTCGVFLYPSHYDNYPTVVNEALSFGLPVVTWKCPFSKFSYSNTSAVSCIKLLDFQGFAEQAVDSFNEREVLAEEAIKFADSFDSLDKVAQQDEKLFEKISLNKYE